jgi:hypothetical protein
MWIVTTLGMACLCLASCARHRVSKSPSSSESSGPVLVEVAEQSPPVTAPSAPAQLDLGELDVGRREEPPHADLPDPDDKLCQCGPVRTLKKDEIVGDGKEAASAINSLSHEWLTGLTWTADQLFTFAARATTLRISLSALQAYERDCGTRIEPLACGGGRFLIGLLHVRTDDGLLDQSGSVRVDLESPPRATLHFPVPTSWQAKARHKDVQELVVTLNPHASAPGRLIAVRGNPNGCSSAQIHVFDEQSG